MSITYSKRLHSLPHTYDLYKAIILLRHTFPLVIICKLRSVSRIQDMLRLLVIFMSSLTSFVAHGIDPSQDLASDTLDDDEEDEDDDVEHDGGYMSPLDNFGSSVMICPKNLEFHHN